MFIGLLCFFFLLTFLPLNQNVKLTFHAELCHFVNYSHFICALLYIRFPKNESDFLYFLFIKTELEQSSDKPLFYAVLGIPVDMPVFNGGDSDTLAVMP